jgi:hypothetical protein
MLGFDGIAIVGWKGAHTMLLISLKQFIFGTGYSGSAESYMDGFLCFSANNLVRIVPTAMYLAQ